MARVAAKAPSSVNAVSICGVELKFSTDSIVTHGAEFQRQCVTSSLPTWLSGYENPQRIFASVEWLAQYDPAGKFHDADIVFQQPLH